MFSLSKIFRRKEPESNQSELIKVDGSFFTPFSGNAYANDIYRGAVDAIARNAAKLKGAHIVKAYTGSGNSSINTLLQTRPNPAINAYDMIYRLVTHYYLYNNAFALLDKDDNGKLNGIYPVKASNADIFTDHAGQYFIKFLFDDGKTYTFPYNDVIHLRRNYNDNDFFGDKNTALLPALELAHTQNEGIIQAINTSANIRGMLKFTQVLSATNKKQEKESFINDYMQMSNNGGIVVTDMNTEYIPIESKPYLIDERQLKASKEKIYSYLGISQPIVDSSYSEQEWAAFYESVIEPIAVQFSLEFTHKIFTQREQSFGNSIVFEANRLQFASAATKAALIKEVMPLGLLSVNQALEILNLPAVADGDRRIVSLNYVNADKADQYQLK